mmetsp:Transcript_1533/g.4613  ORF Transcript_1533/g.4613 Transcript_1533/m.4613 type:complete len:233 (+) Transcript_1533:780-1478(+)
MKKELSSGIEPDTTWVVNVTVTSGAESLRGNKADQGQRRPRKLSHAPCNEVPPTKGSSKTTSTAAERACIAMTVPRCPNGAPIWSVLNATTRSPRRGGASLTLEFRMRADKAVSPDSCSAWIVAAGALTVSRTIVACARMATRLVAARCTAATASGDMAIVETGARVVVAVGRLASHRQASSRRTSGSSWPKIQEAPANVITARSALLPFFMSVGALVASVRASKTSGKRRR